MSTLFTLYPTTPEEFTVTILGNLFHNSVISSTTTHQVTSLQSIAVFLTLAPSGAKTTLQWIWVTKVRRIFQVHQVSTRGFLHISADWTKLVLFLVQMHQTCAVKSLFQDFPDFSEWFHLSPADLDRTGTRNAVTLADEVHFFFSNLKDRKMFDYINESLSVHTMVNAQFNSQIKVKNSSLNK